MRHCIKNTGLTQKLGNKMQSLFTDDFSISNFNFPRLRNAEIDSVSLGHFCAITSRILSVFKQHDILGPKLFMTFQDCMKPGIYLEQLVK